MPKPINLLLLLLGLLLAVSSLFLRGTPASFAVIALGVGLIVLALISDYRRKKRVTEEERIETDRRIADLTQAAWPSHQTLKIQGSAWMVLLVLLIGLTGTWAVHAGITAAPFRWLFVLGGAFVMAVTAIAFPRALAGLGKPACEFDADGFVTPIHGRIRWNEVTGINLQQTTHRGVTTSILLVRTELHKRPLPDLHWTERVLALLGLGALRRGIVGVQLRDRREKPQTVYAVARFLWKQATGLDHEWSPMHSDAYNEAARRVGNTATRRLDADALQRYRAKNPREALAELDQMSKDLDTMRSERKRFETRLNWTLAIVLILMLLIFAWPLLRIL